jgi:hypothetical protein
MRKFIKLLNDDGETIFVRPEDIKKVRDFGNNSYSVEVDNEQIEVFRINDKEVNSFDDIMPVILEP